MAGAGIPPLPLGDAGVLGVGDKILVIGSGGREHALVWKISQSPLTSRLLCAPGNPGIASIAECVPIKATDLDALLRFAHDEKIDLTVVGGEDPLVLGLVDAFEKAGLKVFGPTAAAARLEGDKAFAKDPARLAAKR